MIPAYLTYKIGGGVFTWVFFALLLAFPILIPFWTISSRFSPRVNEKARFPGKPVEQYLEFKSNADKQRYRGRNKIAMETFHEMYFDEQVEFKGDALDVLEYRHDWAHFGFTISLYKFFLFQFIPEVLVHSRSQGRSHESFRE